MPGVVGLWRAGSVTGVLRLVASDAGMLPRGSYFINW
jgi:hypothetical protein